MSGGGLERIFFEEFFCGPGFGAIFDLFADLFDEIFGDWGGFIVPVLTNEGEDGGDIAVFPVGDGGHVTVEGVS